MVTPWTTCLPLVQPPSPASPARGRGSWEFTDSPTGTKPWHINLRECDYHGVQATNGPRHIGVN